MKKGDIKPATPQLLFCVRPVRVFLALETRHIRWHKNTGRAGSTQHDSALRQGGNKFSMYILSTVSV